jgi:hypothetical protein
MSEALSHPGTVTYIDGDTNQVVKISQAADLADRSKFAPTKDGPKPVVKVVARASGQFRYVSEYGPGDELLRTTTLTVPS